MKSQVLFTITGGDDSPARVTYQAMPPLNDAQAVAVQCLIECFAEDFPRRCAKFRPTTKIKDTFDSADMAAIRQSVKGLFKIGKAPTSKAYNNALLDVMNLLSKS